MGRFLRTRGRLSLLERLQCCHISCLGSRKRRGSVSSKVVPNESCATRHTFFLFHSHHSPALNTPSTTTATTGPEMTPGFTPDPPPDPPVDSSAGRHWICGHCVHVLFIRTSDDQDIFLCKRKIQMKRKGEGLALTDWSTRNSR